MELILIGLIIIIPLIADLGVKGIYKKYLKEKSVKNLSGQEVARMILDKHGLNTIYVVEAPGYLTDHYDPRRKTVRLSTAVFNGTSISSIAIAAHECGHAIQDKEKYLPLKIRSLIVPIVRIATSISYYIILIGLLLEMFKLVYLGIAFSCFGLLFQIITLPVEFNASKRAKAELEKLNIVKNDEKEGVNKVLTAAIFTYVAGVLASALQILRLIFMSSRRD